MSLSFLGPLLLRWPPKAVTHAVRSSALSFQTLESVFHGACLRLWQCFPLVSLGFLSVSRSASRGTGELAAREAAGGGGGERLAQGSGFGFLQKLIAFGLVTTIQL